jgi:putative FmdB family regulatory protein
MPTYLYQCRDCLHQLKTMQKITAAPLKDCPQCQKETLERKPGCGLGLHFKGEGFYITDYERKDKEKSTVAASET